jgi:arsenical resistance protein ArsH
MFVVPNQSSLPKAWTQFTPAGRLMASDNRDRLVDVCEELVKVTSILRPHFDLLGDRFSERKERSAFGKLRTQAEKEVVAKTLDNEDSE